MARRDRPLRVALLLLATSCAAPAPPPETEPIRPEDLAALPAEVTAANARDVVRRCLQRHAADASTPHRRYGYRFRPEGFEQVLVETFTDGRRDRWSRREVAYAWVRATAAATRLDPTRLRRVTDVSVDGWTLSFDDPDVALALVRALNLLR